MKKTPHVRVIAIFNSKHFLEGLHSVSVNKYSVDDISNLTSSSEVQQIADTAALDLHNFHLTSPNTSAGQTIFFDFLTNTPHTTTQS